MIGVKRLAGATLVALLMSGAWRTPSPPPSRRPRPPRRAPPPASRPSSRTAPSCGCSCGPCPRAATCTTTCPARPMPRTSWPGPGGRAVRHHRRPAVHRRRPLRCAGQGPGQGPGQDQHGPLQPGDQFLSMRNYNPGADGASGFGPRPVLRHLQPVRRGGATASWAPCWLSPATTRPATRSAMSRPR